MAPTFSSGVKATSNAVLPFKCERVTTNSVLANSNCKGAIEPIKLVSLAEVASLRGTELLQSVESAQQQVTTSATGTEDADPDLPLFVALSRGIQPTRGFELHLADQALIVEGPEGEGTGLEIPVHWTAPDPQKSHPLVNTHPCLVVSVPNAGWRHIEAVDQEGNSLGRLTEL